MRQITSAAQLDSLENGIFYYSEAASHSGSIYGYSGMGLSLKIGSDRAGGNTNGVFQIIIPRTIDASGTLNYQIYKRYKGSNGWDNWTPLSLS